MKLRMAVLAASLFAVMAGCQGDPQPVATAGQGEIILAVRPAANIDAAEIVPAANTLSKLPGVLDVSVATGRSSPTATQPSDRTVVFVMTFRPDAGDAAAKDWTRTLADAGYADRIADVTVYTGTLRNYLVSQQFTEETTAATLQRRAAAITQQNELRERTK